MTPTLSPDLFPRRRLRHWIAARGDSYVAWWLAALEARDRRRLSVRLSGHGTISPDAGVDRGGSRGLAPRITLVGRRVRRSP